MVYSSSADGHPVDKKAYNFHMSARPTSGTTNVAGSSCWTLTTVGDIPAGCIVIEDSVAGRLDIATSGAETLLGVATVTRENDDERPLTYTILGVVEMIAGEAIAIGDLLKPSAAANANGSAGVWAADISADADQTAAEKLKFGKALTAASGIGKRFWAYVNFMG